MSATLQESRTGRLAQKLEHENEDVLIAWSPVAMGYLAGFFENAHERFMALCVHRTGKSALICPSLSASQAARLGIADIRPWSDGEDPLALFRNLLKEWNATTGRIAVDPELPAHMLLSIQSSLPGATMINGHELLAGLRRVKDDSEFEAMRAASRIVDEVFPLVLDFVRPGITEIDVADFLNSEMRTRGGKPTFCIVASGAASAEPHHITDDSPIQSGQILLLDFGCELDRYQSDVTRTIHIGPAPQKAKDVYRIVYEAHMAARALIRPGVEAQEIDRAARDVIETAGFGPKFFHRLGHGIGMEGHEEPNMVEGSTYRLEAGNCFSVEPGIYLAGEFGVRIENLAGVTSTGHESFNTEPSAELMEI